VTDSGSVQTASPIVQPAQTVTGLTASTAYNFQVYASNAAGSGPASSPPITATTASAGAATTFTDNMQSFKSNLWSYDSFIEVGDAFWSEDPVDIPNIYVYSGAGLALNLLNKAQSGKILTSGMMKSVDGGASFLQKYGYFELTIAVDKLVGLLFGWTILSYTQFPPAFEFYIATDSGGNQTAKMFAVTSATAGYETSGSFDPSISHVYALNWTSSRMEWYIDNVMVAGFNNSEFNGGDACYMKMFCSSNYAGEAPAVAQPNLLPKGGHISRVNVWAVKPF
jgi:hypothetical protein